MNKSVKILSIISIILSLIGVLLATATLTFLWEPVNILLNSPEVISKATPIIPIGNMVYILGCVIISLVLLASYKSRKFIVIEILSIVFLSFLLPCLTYRLELNQTMLVGHTLGSNSIAILGTANSIMAIPVGFVNLSVALSLITSGMRIIEKVISNKKMPINVLSIISVIISAISFLISIAVLTIFWEPMVSLYVSSVDIINYRPILPIGSVLYIVACLIISIILVVSKKSNESFVVEIITMSLLGFGVPVLMWILNLVQQFNVYAISVSAATEFLISNKVLVSSIGIMKLSSAICLVVSGMRISYKNNYKKTMQ